MWLRSCQNDGCCKITVRLRGGDEGCPCRCRILTFDFQRVTNQRSAVCERSEASERIFTAAQDGAPVRMVDNAREGKASCSIFQCVQLQVIRSTCFLVSASIKRHWTGQERERGREIRQESIVCRCYIIWSYLWKFTLASHQIIVSSFVLSMNSFKFIRK